MAQGSTKTYDIW